MELELTIPREFDYQSIGGELSFVKASQDNNAEFSVKAMAFLTKD